MRWSTLNGSAAAGGDYVAVPLTDLAFAANQTIRTVSVTVNADALDEANETFSVRLTSPTGASISDALGVAAITDDDATYLSINETRMVELDSGTSNATFTISRSGSLTGASSVRWATVQGSADPGSDFVAVPPTTVNFAPGERVKTVTVAVNGDTVDEPNETFTVALSLPSGATIADTRGTATIADNDVPTFLAVNDVTLVEGSGDTAEATFTVTRYGKTTVPVSAKWSTRQGSAAAGSDFVAVPLTDLSFAAGEVTKTVSVTVHSDTLDEGEEMMEVYLSAPIGAVLADEQGRATIVDDDPATGLVINDVIEFDEEAGGTIGAEFTITRSGNTTGPSSVTWSTADGTAIAGADYVAVPPTTVSFAAGETTKRISVTVIDDAVDEENETFFVNLSSPVYATIVDGSGRGEIVKTCG
ncbi:MAG: Calx-beta domain-containing protein [Acidimicrobiales bacterium]